MSIFVLDAEEIGYDIFEDVPDDRGEVDKMKMKMTKRNENYDTTPEKEIDNAHFLRKPNDGHLLEKYSDKFNISTNCTVVLNSIDSLPNSKGAVNSVRQSRDGDGSNNDAENLSNSDNEIFEFEESDSPLIPLYHLRDEASVKWVLLTDLCNVLKVKSKETLLKQVSIELIVFQVLEAH